MVQNKQLCQPITWIIAKPKQQYKTTTNISTN